MSIPFSYIHNKGVALSFMSRSGKVITYVDAEFYEPGLELVREILKTPKDTPEYDALREKLENLNKLAEKVIKSMNGHIEIRGDQVLYDGEPVHNTIVDRIIEGAKEDMDMTSYINFLENLMLNPSNQTVNEVYDFMEANSMGITDDGYLLAYKRVRGDFKDIYTGKMDNSPGTVVRMPRNRVNDDRTQTCSHGLHACSMNYLPHYGTSPENTVVIVKIHPKDVVSIPIDYKNAKMRCCEYLVLAEYTDPDKEDILATRFIWSEEDLEDEFGSEDDHDNFDNDDFDNDDWYKNHDEQPSTEYEKNDEGVYDWKGEGEPNYPASDPYEVAKFYSTTANSEVPEDATDIDTERAKTYGDVREDVLRQATGQTFVPSASLFYNNGRIQVSPTPKYDSNNDDKEV
jgi:hypothetical protein